MKTTIQLIAAALLLASCRTDKEILHTTDTVYIARHHYDSVMIDCYITTETKGDTVFVDRLKTEYRYHTDTVCTTIYKEAPNKSNEVFPLVIVVVVLVLVGGLLMHER